MKLAKKIVDEARRDHGNMTGHNAGFMVIGDTDLEAIIAAHLEPVRDALDGAQKTIERWHNMHDNSGGEAWRIYRENAPEMKPINEASAMLSEEE